jgi:long-subunit fatty acid transport protein
MKNLLFTGATLLLMSLNLHAQSSKGDITLAPQIGVNIATYFTSDADYNSRTNVAAGVIGEYYFSDRWSLRSGFLFDPMGAEDSGNNTDKLNYLSIPIHANWHFGKNRNWYLNFGPQVSFLLSAETEFSNGETLDIKEFISGTDIGLGLGIGYKFDISDNFQLSIDYQEFLGFINIDETGIFPFNLSNSRGSFNVGAVFKI